MSKKDRRLFLLSIKFLPLMTKFFTPIAIKKTKSNLKENSNKRKKII